MSGKLAEWWQIIVGGLFIFVVLVLRDGIVGSIGNWIRAGERRRALCTKIMEESDRRAHDRQLDWRPAGVPETDEAVR